MDSIDVSNSSQNAFLIWRNAWQECMWRFGRNGVFGPKNAKICFFILKHMEVLSRLKVHSHELNKTLNTGILSTFLLWVFTFLVWL